MEVALIILAALVGVGVILYIHHRITSVTDTPETENTDTPATEGCCGMHITCEKDSLLAAVSDRIEYYDDEELDRFAGREATSYTDSETEEFRDVLLTLLPDDIAGWGRSLQLRGIELPQAVRDELFMIVAEARDKHQTSNVK